MEQDGKAGDFSYSLKCLLFNHLGLASTALLLILVVARAWTVSRFSSTTFLVLIQTAKPFTTVVGSLVPYLPTIIWMVLVLLVVWGWVERNNSGRAGLLLAGPIFVVFVLFTSRQDLLLLPVISIAVVLINWKAIRAARRKASPATKIAAKLIGLIVAAQIPIQAFVVQQMWLPSQEITVKGQKAIAGYVLERTESTTTILVERDRKVIRDDTARISVGQFCEIGGSSLALVQRIGSALPKARYPKCPS